MKRGILFGIFGGFGMICGYFISYFTNPHLENHGHDENSQRSSCNLDWIESFPREETGLSEYDYLQLGRSIFQLQENDFPEVFRSLEGFELGDEQRLKEIALAQWCSFDHVNAWNWFEENRDVFGEFRVDGFICEILESGVIWDSVFVFEKQKEQVERLGGYPEGRDPAMWMYRLGRDSTAPHLRIRELEALSESLNYRKFCFSANHDNEVDQDRNHRWFVQGVLKKGVAEIDEISVFLSENYPQIFTILEQEIQVMRVATMGEEAWRGLREEVAGRALPKGDDESFAQYQKEKDFRFAVFKRWMGEDREEAIQWFIHQAPEWERESRICELLSLKIFRKRRSVNSLEQFDLATVTPVLTDFDQRGYPTMEAWNLVISNGVSRGDPDPFFTGAHRITEGDRAAYLNELAKIMAEGSYQTNEYFVVRGLSDYRRDLAQRLKIEEEVEREIRRLNREDLLHFQKAISLDEEGSIDTE